MSGGAIKKLRRKKIKEQLRQQKADKTVAELKEEFVNMSEEQQEELAQAIADIVNEEVEEEE